MNPSLIVPVVIVPYVMLEALLNALPALMTDRRIP